MVVQIKLKNGDLKIYPLVTDLTLTEYQLIIYRKFPDSVKSILENIDEVLKRSQIEKLEVVGL